MEDSIVFVSWVVSFIRRIGTQIPAKYTSRMSHGAMFRGNWDRVVKQGLMNPLYIFAAHATIVTFCHYYSFLLLLESSRSLSSTPSWRKDLRESWISLKTKSSSIPKWWDSDTIENSSFSKVKRRAITMLYLIKRSANDLITYALDRILPRFDFLTSLTLIPLISETMISFLTKLLPRLLLKNVWLSILNMPPYHSIQVPFIILDLCCFISVISGLVKS